MSSSPPPPEEPDDGAQPADTAVAVAVPHEALSADALTGLIDDFILREGTDYGSQNYDLEAKRQAVVRQLQQGRAQIFYDPTTRTTTLVLTE